MPLPSNDTPWPPRELDWILPKYDEWTAWYSGDTERLTAVYTQNAQLVHSLPRNRPWQYRGGLTGAMARMWWGQPVNNQTQARRKLHVPIAADLCQASADLLFAEPPSFKVENNTAAQDQIEALLDDGLIAALAEAAELGGSLGGTYLRNTMDAELSKTPFITKVDADAALPTFRFGRLVAVTFWWIVRDEGQDIWRHLERHELDAAGNGIILHGLYRGSASTLGILVPLTNHPSTAGLASELTNGDTIETGSPGLAVEYIRNQRSPRTWRNDPVGSQLGRSTLDGVEGMMDSLDEVYTSWMRDIRLAKGRLIVPEFMLDTNGTGKGGMVDLDREVYEAINTMPTSDVGITLNQFAIRTAEHAATAEDIRTQILRTSGFSAGTFGDDADGAAMTATEVSAKQQRSFMTRDRMIREWAPALARLLEKNLAMAGVQAERPNVQFPDGVQESELDKAQAAQALRAAEAASTETLVRMVHPDWEDPDILAEVARIKADQPAAPDPTSFRPGVDGQQTPPADLSQA